MKNINDYENPFDAIEEFEKAIGEFTGAKGVIVTDSCTHAIELALRYKTPKMYATIPTHTYISIPMTLKKLGVEYMFEDTEWENEYRIQGSPVWDCARRFEEGMATLEEHSPAGISKMQCLSFGHSKPLELGRGGAILTNDKQAYEWLKRAAYDGRDLSFDNWEDQKEFEIGYHYMMRPEECVAGLNKLAEGKFVEQTGHVYPDLRDITINE